MCVYKSNVSAWCCGAPPTYHPKHYQPSLIYKQKQISIHYKNLCKNCNASVQIPKMLLRNTLDLYNYK